MEDKKKQEMQEKVDKIIKTDTLWSMGVGLIPIPLLDLAALTGIQWNMIRKIAKEYKIPKAKDWGKHIIASLVGSSIPVSVGSTMASLVKAIPVVGQTTGAVSMPVVAGASTYALGKVFVMHFESGGTFLNFDPEEVRETYEKMFKEGKEFAADLKDNQDNAEENNQDQKNKSK